MLSLKALKSSTDERTNFEIVLYPKLGVNEELFYLVVK